MNTKRGIANTCWWMVMGLMGFLLTVIPNVQAQRDRGVNQPGAAGNRGGRDPGVNQPGAAGNRGGRDPGVNQPGAAGNRGVGGSARQTRVAGDPGVNQPGRAGNRQ